MTATPMLLLRGQLLEFGEYAQGESVTPGAGPGLRVQIGARQVVVPLNWAQLQALDLRPDQEVELVIRPLGAAPAAAPPAPPPLFQEGDYSFRTPAGEMLTGSAAERAAMIYARRELRTLVHTMDDAWRGDEPLRQLWSQRLWNLLELLVILTRACPFCGNDFHPGVACAEAEPSPGAAPSAQPAEGATSPALIQRGAQEAAPAVRTRSAVGRQSVPAEGAAPPAREAFEPYDRQRYDAVLAATQSAAAATPPGADAAAPAAPAPHFVYEPYDWAAYEAACTRLDAEGHAQALLVVSRGFLHLLLHPCHCEPVQVPSFVPAELQGDVERCITEYSAVQAKQRQALQGLLAKGSALQTDIDGVLAQSAALLQELSVAPGAQGSAGAAQAEDAQDAPRSPR